MANEGTYRTEKLLEAVTRKSSDWQHESEFRVLQYHSGKYEYPANYLTGIIFGLGTNQEGMEFVRASVDSSEIKPSFYKAEMGNSGYEIVIREHAF